MASERLRGERVSLRPPEAADVPRTAEIAAVANERVIRSSTASGPVGGLLCDKLR